MPKFEIDFDGYVREFNGTVIEANDKEQAEQFALEYISETWPEMDDVQISRIYEIPA